MLELGCEAKIAAMNEAGAVLANALRAITATAAAGVRTADVDRVASDAPGERRGLGRGASEATGIGARGERSDGD